MATWKKALSTLATAGLLASLLGSAFAAPVAAADTAYLQDTTIPSAPLADGSVVSVLSQAQSVSTGEIITFTVTGTSGATISGVLGTGLTKTSSTVATFTGGSATWGAASHVIQLTATTAGTAIINVSSSYLGQAAVSKGEQTITFAAANSLDLAAPKLVVTGGGTANCTGIGATRGGAVDPSAAVITSAAAAPTGTNVGCAWILLRENGDADITTGVPNLSTWAFAISPYGFLSNFAQSGTKLADGAGYVALDGKTYVAVGAKIYTNGAGTSTITWTGTYRGKAYSANTKFTFTGALASLQLTGGFSSNSGGTLKWTAKDANGNRISVTTGEVTAATSAATVATASVSASTTATVSGDVTVTCLKNGQATITVKNTAGTIVSSGVVVTCEPGLSSTVSISPSSASGGSIATVSITVKDEDGFPVVDGTTVDVVVTSGVILGTSSPATKNGVASFKLFTSTCCSSTSVYAVVDDYDAVEEMGGAETIKVISISAAAASTPNASALGVTKTGTYTTATKTPALNGYVTYKMAFGSGNAGATAEIWVASKSASGTWGAFSKLTTRVADSSGNVYFYWRSATAAWLSVRGLAGGITTNAVQTRWR